jgi:hypothetical protein
MVLKAYHPIAPLQVGFLRLERKCEKMTFLGHSRRDQQLRQGSSARLTAMGRARKGAASSFLEDRIDEGRDRGTRCKYDEATQHNQAKDDRQEPEFFSLFHKRPKLQKELAH